MRSLLPIFLVAGLLLLVALFPTFLASLEPPQPAPAQPALPIRKPEPVPPPPLKPQAPAQAEAEASAYEGGPVANGGTIRGRVTVSGKVPPPKQLPLNKDIVECKKKFVESEELVVSAGGGLRYAVVRLLEIKKGKPLDSLGAGLVDNLECVYVPHLVLAPVNTDVVFKNSDTVVHTVDSFPMKNTLSVPLVAGKSATRKFPFPELMHLECQIHKWMSGFLWVCEHPYFAVTDADGNYELKDVPPGAYKLAAWGEFFMDEPTQEVQVGAGAVARADFTFAIK
ncbi:MAG: hypothetical protein HYZ53_03165 [Planctomycetes bacterium]|nr:hypothetical protein [Planctomycetota bacterium]